jgi:hypothetical protein
MSSTSKIITAQVGAKLVTIELSSVNTLGSRKFTADMFGSVGTLLKFSNGTYMLSVELRELKQKWSASGSTIAQCTDKFFAELRYQNEQIAAETPPSDLFQDDQAREDHELNQYEHTKADWDC